MWPSGRGPRRGCRPGPSPVVRLLPAVEGGDGFHRHRLLALHPGGKEVGHLPLDEPIEPLRLVGLGVQHPAPPPVPLGEVGPLGELLRGQLGLSPPRQVRHLVGHPGPLLGRGRGPDPVRGLVVRSLHQPRPPPRRLVLLLPPPAALPGPPLLLLACVPLAAVPPSSPDHLGAGLVGTGRASGALKTLPLLIERYRIGSGIVDGRSHVAPGLRSGSPGRIAHVGRSLHGTVRCRGEREVGQGRGALLRGLVPGHQGRTPTA